MGEIKGIIERGTISKGMSNKYQMFLKRIEEFG